MYAHSALDLPGTERIEDEERGSGCEIVSKRGKVGRKRHVGEAVFTKDQPSEERERCGGLDMIQRFRDETREREGDRITEAERECRWRDEEGERNEKEERITAWWGIPPVVAAWLESRSVYHINRYFKAGLTEGVGGVRREEGGRASDSSVPQAIYRYTSARDSRPRSRPLVLASLCSSPVDLLPSTATLPPPPPSRSIPHLHRSLRFN